MLKHTKIVATISDKRCDVPFIEALYKAGMNVVRLNTAHLDAEGLSRIVNNVRAVSNRIGILIDTKGPEVRTTVTTDGQPIDFKIGDKVQISGNPEAKTSHEHIYVSYRNFVNDLLARARKLIGEGNTEEETRLQQALAQSTPPAAALAYMVFCLVYFPCIATIAAIKNESGRWRWALFAAGYTTALAWVVAFATYRVALLLL